MQVFSLESLVRWGESKQCKVTAVADSRTYNALFGFGSSSSGPAQWLGSLTSISQLHSAQSHNLSTTARKFAALVEAAQLLGENTRYGGALDPDAG
jgi:hypothetical protein